MFYGSTKTSLLFYFYLRHDADPHKNSSLLGNFQLIKYSSSLTSSPEINPMPLSLFIISNRSEITHTRTAHVVNLRCEIHSRLLGNCSIEVPWSKAIERVGTGQKNLKDNNGRINVLRLILSGGGMKSHVSLISDLCRRLDTLNVKCEEGINHQKFGWIWCCRSMDPLDCRSRVRLAQSFHRQPALSEPQKISSPTTITS